MNKDLKQWLVFDLNLGYVVNPDIPIDIINKHARLISRFNNWYKNKLAKHYNTWFYDNKKPNIFKRG